jgi:hypothetical protein
MTITNATHGRVARRARREETRLCTDERPQDVIRDSWCRRHAVGPASWRRVNDRYHIWKDPAVLGRRRSLRQRWKRSPKLSASIGSNDWQ